MSKREKVLDDIAGVAGGAVGVISNAKQSIGDAIKTHVDSIAHDMDLVPRDEFERLEHMIVELREEQEKLKQEIALLKAK